MDELIPVVVDDTVPTALKLKREADLKKIENILPSEVLNIISRFEESIVSPNSEDAIVLLEKENLLLTPHFFYIISEREKFIKSEILNIRKHIETVLSPLFVNINLYTDLMKVVDGVFKQFSEDLIDESIKIWEVINKFDHNPYVSPLPENRQISLIQYMTSRNIDELRPVLHKLAINGFYYPLAHYTIFPDELGGEIEDLEYLKLHKIFTSEINNKTSTCPFCEHYNLIFREVCPSCGSVRIKITEFIHHYVCGYVGPIDEFIKGDKLVCPKCHDELKHIGVDYDKPLEQYICEDCGAKFIEPDIDVLCANCKKKMSPDDVNSEFVHTYYITPFGKLTAVEGKLPINVFEEITVRLGIVNFNAFSYITEKFLKIAKRYPERNFCVLALFFSIPESSFMEIPLKIKIFLKDLVKIIKDNLRESDIISTSEDKYLFVLLPETSSDGGRRVYERLSNQINQLIQKNKLDKYISVKLAVKCVSSKDSYGTAKELFDSLISEIES